MPRELTSFEGVGVGDVLMVKQMVKFRGETHEKPWRWFAVVETTDKKGRLARIYRIGADGDEPRYLSIKALRMDEHIWLLHPDEWPDGVHAFRAKMIMTGKIDI